MATQVDQAVAWARSKLGTTKYSGRCQAFVADCYAYGAGMPRKSASSAKVARALWLVSTSSACCVPVPFGHLLPKVPAVMWRCALLVLCSLTAGSAASDEAVYPTTKGCLISVQASPESAS